MRSAGGLFYRPGAGDEQHAQIILDGRTHDRIFEDASLNFIEAGDEIAAVIFHPAAIPAVVVSFFGRDFASE